MAQRGEEPIQVSVAGQFVNVCIIIDRRAIEQRPRVATAASADVANAGVIRLGGIPLGQDGLQRRVVGIVGSGAA